MNIFKKHSEKELEKYSKEEIRRANNWRLAFLLVFLAGILFVTLKFVA